MGCDRLIVVDITSYILLEWGQLLHAFDRSRMLAVAGGDPSQSASALPSPENRQTLDSQTRMLTAQTLLITANDQPVVLAGVR